MLLALLLVSSELMVATIETRVTGCCWRLLLYQAMLAGLGCSRSLCSFFLIEIDGLFRKKETPAPGFWVPFCATVFSTAFDMAIVPSTISANPRDRYS